MRRFATQPVGRTLCFGIGIVILIVARPAHGQSGVTPPKKSPEVINLEKFIKQIEVNQKQIQELIVSNTGKSELLSTELDGLKKLESQMSVSEESYPEVLRTLHSQRVQLLIDLAGIEARSGAIQQAIAQITDDQLENLINPLNKLVEIREAELDRLKSMVEQGVVSTSALREAEIAILEAKTRLAQAQSTSGGALGQLNSQLLATSLEKTEKSARLSKTSSLIKEVDEYRIHASKVSEKRGELRSLGSEIVNLKNELSDLAQTLVFQKAELRKLTSDDQ